eukprot:5193717-Prymnesium_polylepis.1
MLGEDDEAALLERVAGLLDAEAAATTSAAGGRIWPMGNDDEAALLARVAGLLDADDDINFVPSPQMTRTAGSAAGGAPVTRSIL